MAMEIGAEYASSLADLTVNSKPLINMLTILAEENQEHAAVIVSAIETHLEEVRPEIKLPVLYLVDSICKNVGGAYTQHFAKSIVNMFTSTFKQVDERTRSQMFKLRETWNEIFPPGKLFQLDVKVNLVDPAWPIESHPPRPQPSAQPQPPVIHLNPHFHKKGTAAATVAPPAVGAGVPSGNHEQEILSELARKQKELLELQRKKIEMEMEAKRRQLTHKQGATVRTEGSVLPMSSSDAPSTKIPVQARLGPPVSSRVSTSASGAVPTVTPGGGGSRITPVTAAMLAGAARRADPRLARRTPAPHHTQPPPVAPQPPVAPDVFDIKPLERTDRVTKRKNAITIDVQPELAAKVSDAKPRDPRARRDQRDPRLERKRNRIAERKVEHETLDRDTESKHKNKASRIPPKLGPSTFPVVDAKVVNRLPPIPKIAKAKPTDTSPPKLSETSAEVQSPSKRKKEAPTSPRGPKKLRKRENKSSSSSPEKGLRNGPKEIKPTPEVPPPVEPEQKKEEVQREAVVEPVERRESSDDELVAFRELKNSTRERNYIRRNREKSESPEKEAESPASPDVKCDAPPPSATPVATPADPPSKISPPVSYRRKG